MNPINEVAGGGAPIAGTSANSSSPGLLEI